MSEDASAAGTHRGKRLFDRETFGGNGRTCRTCHSGDDGTIDPEEVAERLGDDPSDPLFAHDGLDDFVSGTTRIATHATILIERELPEGVVLLDDPLTTSVVFARGVPSTLNTPALDPALMYDLRNADLQDQASGAIDRHAQATIPPTREQLDAIAAFQQSDKRFFSSNVLRRSRPEVCRRPSRKGIAHHRSADGSSSWTLRGTHRARRVRARSATAGRS